MENRGHKRPDMVDELPADKRACNSLEFRPSSSNSSVQTHIDSNADVHDTETHNTEMDTSSSDSASSHSEEEEPERESAYESCDSEEADRRRRYLENFHRHKSSEHGRLMRALSNLNEASEPSEHLAALTELCEVLAFCSEDSLSNVMADSLSPVLVRLARHENNPDIMLLAIRALTYLCDVFPRASAFLVRHDAIPALCERLMAIEYLDVAEQCFQALEKISRDQPLPCLQAGAIMAVLQFIDFFSTSVQRVALQIVVNMCKKLPTECSSHFMEAVPILCNLLQYEDRQLVENVATCFIKVAERVNHSSDMLDELCKHGLINQATHLLHLNSRTTLSQPIYNGLIGLLAKLASGSTVAFRTLYELNISSILKDILAAHDLSHGVSSPIAVDGQGNQVLEVLKFLNELLPAVAKDQEVHEVSDRESFLVNHSDILRNFGLNVLPMLIQVVNSGANLYVCYGCLSVIYKLVYFSKSDMLVELLKSANIPSFLAGVFTRKDHHVLMLALQIAEVILQKLSDVFLNSFIKEGVFFAIDSLLTPEKSSHLMFPVLNEIQFPFHASQKSVSKVALRCLCYAFDSYQSPPASEVGMCKLEKDSVQNLAKHIRSSHFTPVLCNSDKGFTDILQKLRSLSTELSDLMNSSLQTGASNSNEEKFHCLLLQIMSKLNGAEPVSTFEFIESGIVKSLVKYISNGQYMKENVDVNGVLDHRLVVQRRFEVFARLFMSSSDMTEELAISVLIRKLQNALSSLENFPVILSHGYKQKNSFAAVPYGRSVSHPCVRVRFVREEGESSLADYSENALTVDPLSSLEAIGGFLLPKVLVKKDKRILCAAKFIQPREGVRLELPADANLKQGENSDLVGSDRMFVDLPEVQETVADLSQSSPEQAANSGQGNPGETLFSNPTIDAVDTADREHEIQFPSGANNGVATEVSASCSNEESSPKLLFYLEGQQLKQTSTLYQGILQHKVKLEHELDAGAKLWSQVYTLTYKTYMEPKDDESPGCLGVAQSSSLLEKTGAYILYSSFLSSLFDCEVASGLDESSPTYDILFLLKSLEGLNKFNFQLMSHERVHAFAEGLVDNLDNLRVVVRSVSQNEFVSSKLTEKLEQQMRDSLAVSTGGLPLWCNQLMASCPFLFGFEARCKYYRLSAFGPQQISTQAPPHDYQGILRDRRPNSGSASRKKFLVNRDRILESAAQMMDLHARVKVPVEVMYEEEVGTGLGPTLEFYTLVSHEFQKFGLGMWREDNVSISTQKSLQDEDSGIMISAFGLFPRPWPSTSDAPEDAQFSEVIKKFVLLGQLVAKALQDGRVLDLPFSKAFYRLILEQELNLYDIQSFDPELGRTLTEFQALVKRRKILGSSCGENSYSIPDACFRNTRIEDLTLDFTLPGYPDYILSHDQDQDIVTMDNLEEYLSRVVDATIHTGISRQVEAFKSGFNQVFPIKHLQIFREEEVEHLLCGQRDLWAFDELLDHIKFDHGYTASSLPISNLLEIIQEFNNNERRAFLQFVTGAPRLPPGGLASLNPKLTIVRKHFSNSDDADLPSVMTCANYLKLPPYSSKEKMKEKLLYAITEGQGSFHLS
ncbi:hypothetical protein K2173_019455 [Erythroxylum novogranatense]|uniref:HECT-type E3 ubiquitin transferase n=1 Tax=Erythroxylum novogranatense TaxID=1862640 RepID=A0AAV8UB10_9ROSI|nr:hypothetical protein K2173_019455 [Erythroxylum novogranatense]